MVGWLAQESGPIQARFGSGENLALWLIFGVSLVALLFAWYLVREVLAAPEGTEKMKEIARAIQEGAKAYLNRQYRTLAVFLAVLAVVLFFVLPVPKNAEHSALSIRFGRSIAFLLGALASMVTGYVGMWLAVRANVRTANAARESGLRRAVRIAFRAGGVAGMFTVGLGAVRRDLDPHHLQGRRDERVGRLRVRRCAARDVHAGRRRDLHEGGRRGRRPGREDRAGHPRG
jgi:K(+)-stimulated pyrophosphate-energized sodium pump